LRCPNIASFHKFELLLCKVTSSDDYTTWTSDRHTAAVTELSSWFTTSLVTISSDRVPQQVRHSEGNKCAEYCSVLDYFDLSRCLFRVGGTYWQTNNKLPLLQFLMQSLTLVCMVGGGGADIAIYSRQTSDTNQWFVKGMSTSYSAPKGTYCKSLKL
jgi:hypothetical protein